MRCRVSLQGMNAAAMHRVNWLLIAAFAACTNTHGPKDGTQTGNPPVLDDGRVSLEVSADEVHITGKPAAVKPAGATIEITNLSTSKVITGMAAADGSFDIRVDGSVNDTFAVRVVADGKESAVVYVVRGGALVAEDDDVAVMQSIRRTGARSARGKRRGRGQELQQRSRLRPDPAEVLSALVATPAYVSNAGMRPGRSDARSRGDGLCTDPGKTAA